MADDVAAAAGGVVAGEVSEAVEADGSAGVVRPDRRSSHRVGGRHAGSVALSTTITLVGRGGVDGLGRRAVGEAQRQGRGHGGGPDRPQRDASQRRGAASSTMISYDRRGGRRRTSASRLEEHDERENDAHVRPAALDELPGRRAWFPRRTPRNGRAETCATKNFLRKRTGRAARRADETGHDDIAAAPGVGRYRGGPTTTATTTAMTG